MKANRLINPGNHLRQLHSKTRKTVWICGIASLLINMGVAQALQGLDNYSKDHQAEVCPNAWPNINNQYYRRMQEYNDYQTNPNHSNQQHITASNHFDQYMECGHWVIGGAHLGLAAYTINKQKQKFSIAPESLEHLKASHWHGDTPGPNGVDPLRYGIVNRAMEMGYHGAPVENTTRALFCECLNKNLGRPFR